MHTKLLSPLHCLSLLCLLLAREVGLCGQLLTKFGILNVPQWYESGRVFQEQHPDIPYRAPLPDCPLAPLASPHPLCLACPCSSGPMPSTMYRPCPLYPYFDRCKVISTEQGSPEPSPSTSLGCLTLLMHASAPHAASTALNCPPAWCSCTARR